MDRLHEKYELLIARCKGMTPIPTAVAHPCDESSLKGAVEAAKLGILKPILVGPRGKIEAGRTRSWWTASRPRRR